MHILHLLSLHLHVGSLEYEQNDRIVYLLESGRQKRILSTELCHAFL